MKGLAVLAAASVASAHTIFTQLQAGGTTYPVSYAIRDPTYDGPIQDVTSNDLACNGGPNPTMPSDKIITVTAGSTVQAVWRHTLTSGADDVMDASHKGPTIAYLKKVDNALTDSGIGNGWFKIQEDGYNSGNWGTSKVISNGGLHSITIPKCIPNGQYLLRAEMIALHAAGSSGGAQLYMECAQINVTGGTASASPATYSIPGIYKANDPGLLINIYSMTSSSTYTIPGPKLFSCDGSPSGGGSSDGGSTPTTSSKPATTLTTSTTAKTTTTAAPGGCSVAAYGQCGGIGYTGCTTCASGSTCKKSNDYYSQCL
ncbi:Carbohydrate-binding module family 1 protein [Coniochaeta hoffmannii]|uniref:lytic cellulose monooxygenase (C4-dehydrogenating) n=1 Tax=Coniochaeta hoffmannii TaxID=91930 RepID=A0AA38RDB1_9PEZI|nr:Carbohydrate-binding module family 1 protein [Coniochaeta hoffmannii]